MLPDEYSEDTLTCETTYLGAVWQPFRSVGGQGLQLGRYPTRMEYGIRSTKVILRFNLRLPDSYFCHHKASYQISARLLVNLSLSISLSLSLSWGGAERTKIPFKSGLACLLAFIWLRRWSHMESLDLDLRSLAASSPGLGDHPLDMAQADGGKWAVEGNEQVALTDKDFYQGT